jgi:hypothetical protein
MILVEGLMFKHDCLDNGIPKLSDKMCVLFADSPEILEECLEAIHGFVHTWRHQAAEHENRGDNGGVNESEIAEKTEKE